MVKPILDGDISREIHEYLRRIAETAHQNSIDLAASVIEDNRDEQMRLVLSLAQDTNDLQKWLSVLTKTGGYEALENYIQTQKRLRGMNNG